jgi:glucose/mannose transport system substrate-binding protein
MTEDNSVTRRTYLKAAGVTSAAGMAGLAGCTGNGGSETEGTDGGSGETTDGSSGGDGSSSMNALEVQHAWGGGDGKAAFSALIEGFKENHPDVEFEVQPVSGGANKNLNSVIKKRARNQNLPGTWQDWPGANLIQFTEAGLLGDIEESVWSQNNMKDAYLEGPKRAARPDGNYVTVPINIHRLNNLFYNKAVVEEAGVDPSSLSSPSDLLDAMVAVEENTEAVGMAQSTKAPWTTLQLWAAVFMGQNDASAYMDVLEGGGDKGAVQSAFETVASYGDHFNSDAATISWTEGNTKVMNGAAAFIHQGDWAAGAYRGSDDFNYEEDWGHVPFPGTDGLYALNMDSFPYGVNGDDGNPSPEATKQFLRYCGTKDAQIRFNKNKGSIPPRSDVSSDEFGPFLSKQMEDFSNSEAQPPSVTHGLGVTPGVLSDLKSAVSNFNANFEAAAAADGFMNALE